jgi:hypothetical protein
LRGGTETLPERAPKSGYSEEKRGAQLSAETKPGLDFYRRGKMAQPKGNN